MCLHDALHAESSADGKSPSQSPSPSPASQAAFSSPLPAYEVGAAYSIHTAARYRTAHCTDCTRQAASLHGAWRGLAHSRPLCGSPTTFNWPQLDGKPPALLSSSPIRPYTLSVPLLHAHCAPPPAESHTPPPACRSRSRSRNCSSSSC
jgi:hypothetical protein